MIMYNRRLIIHDEFVRIGHTVLQTICGWDRSVRVGNNEAVSCKVALAQVEGKRSHASCPGSTRVSAVTSTIVHTQKLYYTTTILIILYINILYNNSNRFVLNPRHPELCLLSAVVG